MVTSTEKVSALLTEKEELRAEVELVVNAAPVIDVHTHLFPHEFNDLRRMFEGNFNEWAAQNRAR